MARKHALTPYTPQRGEFSSRTFKPGTISISRDIKTPGEFVRLIESAIKFDKGRRFISEYMVIAYGEDSRTKEKEYSFTVSGNPALIDLYYKTKDKNTFREWSIEQFNHWVEKTQTEEKARYFKLRFFRVVLITDQAKKNAEDEARKIRAEKQRLGREAAQRERELQKREAAQSKARKTREENKARLAQGLPKLKRVK